MMIRLTSCFRDAPDFLFAAGPDFEHKSTPTNPVLYKANALWQSDRIESQHLSSLDEYEYWTSVWRCFTLPLSPLNQTKRKHSSELLFCLKSLWWAPALSSYITKWWHNIWGSGAGIEHTRICSHNESLEVTRGVIWIIINNLSSKRNWSSMQILWPCGGTSWRRRCFIASVRHFLLSCDSSQPWWFAYCS